MDDATTPLQQLEYRARLLKAIRDMGLGPAERQMLDHLRVAFAVRAKESVGEWLVPEGCVLPEQAENLVLAGLVRVHIDDRGSSWLRVSDLGVWLRDQLAALQQ